MFSFTVTRVSTGHTITVVAKHRGIAGLIAPRRLGIDGVTGHRSNADESIVHLMRFDRALMLSVDIGETLTIHPVSVV